MKESSISYILLRYVFLLYACLMPIKLSFYFNGASRYIPLRATIILSILCLMIVTLKRKIYFNRRYLNLFIIYIIISILFILSWTVNFGYDLADIAKLSINFIFPILIIFNISIANTIYGRFILDKMGRMYCISSMILIMVETSLRFFAPHYAYRGDEFYFQQAVDSASFYLFKYSSIMYTDSNYVALHLLVLFPLAYLVFKKKSFKKLSIIVFILLILALSRSAYIVVFLMFIVYTFKNYKLSKYIITLIILLSPIFIYIIDMSFTGISDGSFQTKITLFEKILIPFDNMNLLEILFGKGFDFGAFTFSFRQGEYAHALIPLLFGEMGVLGLFIYLFILWSTLTVCGPLAKYIVIIIIVCGFSLVYPYDSIYVFTLSIFYFINNRETYVTS